MRNERYELEISHASMAFEFVSEGPKGFIRKRVVFQESTSQKNIYNLAFGDVDPDTNDFNDLVITNNQDTEKVLSTVASTVFAFIDEYANARIYAKGSTPSRTRLYRIGISNNLEELKKVFDVYGLLDNEWVVYQKNENYSAFIIQRKTLRK